MEMLHRLDTADSLLVLFMMIAVGCLVDKIKIGSFGVVDASTHVSLGNLTAIEYASIGKFTRRILDECHAEFIKSRALQ